MVCPSGHRCRAATTRARNMAAESSKEQSSTSEHVVSDATALEHTPRRQGARCAVGCVRKAAMRHQDCSRTRPARNSAHRTKTSSRIFYVLEQHAYNAKHWQQRLHLLTCGKVLPPWFALAIIAASSDCQGQEYGGRTHQGAVLNKRVSGIGRHYARMYATKTRRSMCSELREESSHASPQINIGKVVRNITFWRRESCSQESE